jgi:predicted ArsR family transcriptional regulator
VDASQVVAVGALADPTRRRVYELVAAAPGPVGRDEVAGGLAVGRTLAAFHLDKLAEVGLLEVTFGRPDGRSGPGAGRPAKLYAIAAAEVSVQLPARSYGELAVMLAEALDRTGNDQVAFDVARAAGVAAGRGAAGSAPVEQLTQWGYAPDAVDGTITLRNCPFHVVAHEFPPLICGMNLALLTGMAEGSGWTCTASMDSAPGRCCVVLSSKTND